MPESPLLPRNPLDDADWSDCRGQWDIRPDTIYLNHGSFGPAPRPVLQTLRHWQDSLAEQPMDFYLRRHEPAWRAAHGRLAGLLGSRPENLTLLDNATYGMNVVADSFPLAAGDEVLLTDHEYGAVRRIWDRRCRETGAQARIVNLPFPAGDQAVCVEEILRAVTPRTRLLVVSHITSPTALVLPVRELIDALHPRGVAVCIDGPHAVAQLPLQLDSLGADFYTASCHKWLCAPLGSGFLHVAPAWHEQIRPPILSWGRLKPAEPGGWSDEFLWSGTRDPAALLTIPAAIDFFKALGWENFRLRSRALAEYARERLQPIAHGEPSCPADSAWTAGMALVPLPPGEARPLQSTLWEHYGIEVPIIDFAGSRFVRVSAHLYNTRAEMDRLADALEQLLRDGL